MLNINDKVDPNYDEENIEEISTPDEPVSEEKEISVDDIFGSEEIGEELEINDSDVKDVDAILKQYNSASASEPEENKHKQLDKHRLPWDSIFKGKKMESDQLDDSHPDFMIPKHDKITHEVGGSGWFESYDPAEYDRLKKLKERVYEIILTKTDVNIKTIRRKPGRNDFNKFFKTLVNNLDMKQYSHSEVFYELSYYFSDNLYNMFKLLEQKWGGKIVQELVAKYNISGIDDLDFV